MNQVEGLLHCYPIYLCRVVENANVVARQIVKKQLKEIQNIQKGHVKANEQLMSKNQSALDALQKNYHVLASSYFPNLM